MNRGLYGIGRRGAVYQSEPITITGGGTYRRFHNLGGMPARVQAIFRFFEASGSYRAGDELILGTYNAGGGQGIEVARGPADVSVIIGASLTLVSGASLASTLLIIEAEL